MEVKVLTGDLFNSKAQTLVNTVNCVGVMGKGVALEFKNRFPDMFEDYLARCRRHEVKLGWPYLYKIHANQWILNFPTKDHWRSLSRVEDIVAGLNYLLQHYKEWGIKSLAVPPLGSGQGGLEWRIVGPILHRYLGQMDIPVELYAPHDTPTEELQLSFLQKEGKILARPEKERMNPAWVALVEILRRIESEPYHWPVGRTTFQKIAFVATSEGLPTGLNFQRGSYGPYAAELKNLTARLLNHHLILERQSGKMFAVSVGPSYEVAKKEYAGELAKWHEQMDRVADLFVRLRTNQAEIVATVLCASQELSKTEKGIPSEKDVLSEVMAWKQKRRPPLDEGEVASTIRNLAMLGWLKVKASTDLPIAEVA
ncbi:MAG: macro domain-containing protein [bacterium]